MDSRERVTDIMVRVASIAEAVALWSKLFGLMVVNDGREWVMLEDQVTSQKIVLTEKEFGASCAISIATSNLEATVEKLDANGAVRVLSANVPGGGRFELWHLQGGPDLLLYEGE